MQLARYLATDSPGVTRLFDKAAFSPTRYPHLQAVFERMVVASVENLREVCTVPPQYAFEEVQAEPLGSVLDAVNEDGMAAIFSVPEWNSRVLFAIDRAFIYTIAELFFGGDGSEPEHQEKRRFSPIEKSLARAVLASAAKSLQAALAPAATLTFVFERIETNMDLAVIDKRDSQAVSATFSLRALGRIGKLRVVIPSAAVRSSRVQRRETDEQDGAESSPSSFTRQMHDEIKNTDVTLRAVLEEKRITLAEIAGLKVGQLIPLQAGVDSRIKLECNDQALFLCEVGQKEGAYTLRVDEILERPGRIGA